MTLKIPDFSKTRVLVVGDLMLDRYWHGDTSRISPEAPVPVVHVGQSEERAGGAGNVALNIAALGGTPSLLGLTGDDEAAVALEKLLHSSGVQCHFLKLSGSSTITKLRIISRHQQLIRLDFEDGFSEQEAGSLNAGFENLLQGMRAVVLSDYGKGTLRDTQNLIQLARRHGVPVLVDPKGADFSRYQGASLITPNMSEFEAIVGSCADEAELVQRGEKLMKDLALDALLVTRSEKGMSLLQKGKAAVHLPTRAREVFDVTGAGDTVISTLAAALAAGETLEDAMALSNLAAGIVVSKLGTATASVSELRRALRDDQEVESGVVSEEKLGQLIREAKTHNETVVMTNGCFDILHAGHVTYLEQARQLGDRLVVAVNTDESVRKLKGPDRPVNSVDRRMRMLSALQCVDWVVSFTEDTPTRLICALCPDILVKGGDNDPDQIPGGECVREAGGKVMALSYIEGVSTTNIIKSIRDKDGG